MKYTYEISKNKIHEKSFAVTLLKVPPFPYDDDDINPVVKIPLTAVIASVKDEDGWSFCALSPEEKTIIADMLFEQGANHDEWWWCTQWQIS